MAVNTSMFVKIGANIKDFSSKMQNVQRTLGNTSKRMKSIGKSMTMSVTAPLAGFAALSVRAFAQQAEAETKLLTALKGNEKAFKSLTKQAKELQKVTLFGDEETMAAQALIAAMVKEEEQILRVMPLVQDFATAKGMDLAGAADLVSKTLGSSTNALSRYGIEVTGAVGSTERLESLTKGLTNAFQGQAEAVSKVGAGPLIQLKNQFGDLMEDIGALVMGAMIPLLEALKKGLTAFQNFSTETKKAIVVIAGIAGAIGPVVFILGSMLTALSALLTPIGAVALALGLLGLTIAHIINNWEALKERFSDIGWWKNALIDMIAFFIENNPFSFIIDAYNKVAELFGKEGVENPFDLMADKIRSLKSDTKAYQHQITSLVETIKAGAGEIKEVLSSVSIAPAPTTAGGGGGTGANAPMNIPSAFQSTDPSAGFEPQMSAYLQAAEAANKKLDETKQKMLGIGEAIGSALAQGADNFKDFGKTALETIKAVIGGIIAEGVALAVKNALASPLAKVPALIPVLTGAAAGLAKTAFNSLMPAFAQGGIVTGPTMGLIGEAGTEVIFPLNKLKQFMGEGMGGKVEVQGVLTGNDIFLSNARTNVNLSRVVG